LLGLRIVVWAGLFSLCTAQEKEAFICCIIYGNFRRWMWKLLLYRSLGLICTIAGIKDFVGNVGRG